MADKRKKFEDSFDDNEFLSNLRKTDPARPPKKGSSEYVQDVQEAKNFQNLPKYADVTTQGKKGHAVKRINLCFTAENHRYMKNAAQTNGKTIAEFFNDLVNQYRNSPKGYVQDVQEDSVLKSSPLTVRINMGLTDSNYAYLKTESRKRGISATELTNTILANYKIVPPFSY